MTIEKAKIIAAVQKFNAAHGDVATLREAIRRSQGEPDEQLEREKEEAEELLRNAAEDLAGFMSSVRHPSGDPQYSPRGIEFRGVIYLNVGREGTDPACIVRLGRDEIQRLDD